MSYRSVRQSFTAPGSANLAPETVPCNTKQLASDPTQTRRAQLYLESLGAATGASLQIQMLKPGGVYTNAADWVVVGQLTAVGLGAVIDILGRPARGVVLSAGTGGTVVGWVMWEDARGINQ